MSPCIISWSPKGGKAWVVVADNYVTMEDGTGIVHIAPAFGEDDNRVCKQNGIAFVNLVDTQGCLTKEPSGRACSSKRPILWCWTI